MKAFLTLFGFIICLGAFSQGSSINTTGAPAHSSSMLDVSSTDKGFLMPRLTTEQRLAIINPAEGLEVYDLTAHAILFFNGIRWLEVGSDPLGTIKAWHKNFPDTPALPWGWIECNGQMLNDSESPYNGKIIPDLNNAIHDTIEGGYFLRGSLVSGGFQNDTIESHSHSPTHSGYLGTFGTVSFGLNGAISYKNWRSGDPITPSDYYGTGRAHISIGTKETRPYNMSVVWIIRIK